MNLCTLASVEFVPLLCGFLYALIVGELFLSFTMAEMRKLIREKPPDSNWQSHVTGCVERMLYILSFLVGKPEFVAAWLVFKVARGLKYYEPQEGEDKHIGRAKYSNSFTGNAISILYAAVGYLIIVWWNHRAAIFVGAQVFLSLVLWGYLYVERKSPEWKKKGWEKAGRKEQI
jgi:hypothetical protein